ncbi:shootin-1-like [Macadamia integrifolia]|uniref:shootin-1-like n=1 Tax=Macadamia integrifolia TaxID=60698 RepID=UPI001C532CD2|nr:shootin-1-like [Macadamia integrifolia]
MAKPEDVVMEPWGTWEELLLACAVNRHGTNSWDSVAMEIQNRNTSLRLLTPQNCKLKYHDLKRRFMAKDDKTVVGEDKSESPDDKDGEIPWLEDLRKLRVAELRREVQRYDVSIVSLQLKVKRLEEEREQSIRGKENGEQKPDLENDSDRDGVKEEEQERDTKPEKSSPANVAEASVPGEESDRENQSYNESNSTDPKVENRKNGVVEAEKKPEAVEPVQKQLDPVSGDSKHVAEGSYSHHGSSDTIAKESTAQPVRKSPGINKATKEGNSPELWESVAESKGGGEEGHKESSDVQSSASLSRKKRRKKVISGSSSGEERENDEVSPAIKRISVKSQPLMSILEIIRSHKSGSVFERRLESQETSEYRNLIKQHLDLEVVQARLEEGRYSSCSRKFFRDLLLLFNNAIVFFPKNSSEWVAAVALRQLVSKELANRNRKVGQPKEDTTAAPASPVPPPPPAKPRPKPEPEPPDSQLAKPKSSGPIVACRKRSSISTKPSSAIVDKKGEQKAAAEAEEKKVSDRKQSDSSAIEEQNLTRKRTRERSGLGTRSSRTRSKSRTNKNLKAGSSQNSSPGPNSGSTSKRSAHDEEPKTERKSNTTGAVAKKRSAANFLNRMKRTSSSNGTLLESLKSSVNNSSNGKGGGGEAAAEQKRGGGKSDGRKDHGSRQSSGGKQAATNQSSPAKRSVGRPPKRASAPPPLPPPAPSKRTRETVHTEVVTSRQSRKRARR